MHDSFFAIAALIAIAGMVATVVVASNAIREAKVEAEAKQQLIYSQEADLEDYSTQLQLREAQLAEARSTIDILNGELTAANLSLAQARAEKAAA